MAGRPDDDDDIGPGEADDRDLEEMDKRAEKMERGDDAREELVEEEEDPEAYLVEEERAPRRERRNARYDEIAEERDRERARAAALEAQLLMRSQPPQQAALQQSFQEFAANINNELAELQKAEITLQSLAQNVDPQSDTFAALLAQKRDIDLRRSELGYMYAQAKHAPAPQRQVAPEMAFMKQKYADVDGDPAGAAHARAYFLQQEKKGLKKPAIEVVEDAYQYARSMLAGKPFSSASQGRPRPTVESRAKLTGASTGGNGQGSAQPQRQRVTLSKEDAQIARETYKYVKDEQKRLQLYYREIVVPREREANSERRRA